MKINILKTVIMWIFLGLASGNLYAQPITDPESLREVAPGGQSVEQARENLVTLFVMFVTAMGIVAFLVYLFKGPAKDRNRSP